MVGMGLPDATRPIMELKPGHPRHPHVCDQAGRAVKAWDFRKSSARWNASAKKPIA